MRIGLIVVVAAGLAVGLAACNNNAGSVVPQTARVDSAVAAAPDTIKAMSVDSGVRKGYGRDSGR